jgi:peptidoglycan/LPS O-acetylase OafA/YrhL
MSTPAARPLADLATPALPAAPVRAARPAEHFGELDVLRGLAAVAVMLFHYTARYAEVYGFPSPLPFHVGFGHYGVELFFGISGFVILMTLQRTRSAGHFLVSRFSRLYPAYWAALLLTFTVMTLVPLPGREVHVGQLLVNFTMWQELLGVKHIDHVYWSLQLELIFYVWMFGAYLTGQLSRVRLWVALWLAASLVVAGGSALLGRDAPYLPSKLLLLPYAALFSVGLVTYDAMQRRTVDAVDVLLVAAAVLCAGLWHGPGGAAACAVTATVFALFATRRLTWLTFGPLVWLGSISYMLYLVHQNIGYAVIDTALRHGAPPLLAVVVAIAVTLSLAATISRWIERPAMAWIRGRWSKRRSATAPNPRSEG